MELPKYEAELQDAQAKHTAATRRATEVCPPDNGRSYFSSFV